MPVDLGGHRSSGIMAIAYARLKKALGISTGDIYVYDMVQQLAIVEPPVLEALGIDAVEMGRGFLTDDSQWKDWTLPDGTPCKIPNYINVDRRGDDWWLLAQDGRELGVQKKGCLYFEQTFFPMEHRSFESDDFSDLAEMFKYTIWTATPHPGAHFSLDGDGVEQLAEGARRLRESTDRAIIGLFGGNLFEVPQWLYRNENYFCNLASDPEGAERLSAKLCDIYMESLEKWLRAVGPYIDVVLFGDDFGGQSGPLISPMMFRKYFKPFQARMWARAHQLADVKIMIHSCGGIEPLLEDMIEAGLDAANPVQITCKGMEPTALKARYGKRFTFWGGGCDTRHILPHGTPEEVRRHVQEQVRIFSPGGGFVFQQVHNVMADVPPENIIAMYEAIGSVRM